MAVAGEPDRGSEDVLPAFEVALCHLELGPCGLLSSPDPILLGLQELERNRVRVEGLQELAPLLGEPGEHPRQGHPALRGLGLTLDDLGLELLGEPVDPLRGQLDPPTQVLHESLGIAGEEVGLAAVGLGPSGLTQAVEYRYLPLARAIDACRTPRSASAP